MVERGDDLWLTRIGLDPDGALYKMYNNLGSASGNEKKTRTWEGTERLDRAGYEFERVGAAGHARNLWL